VRLSLVIDMNLSPEWVQVLQAEGFEAVHWSKVGRADAADSEVMSWAVGEGRVVLTHDLDFGAILAAAGARSPSVVLLRGPDILADRLAGALVAALRRHVDDLSTGALLVIDLRRSRVRMLPLDR